MDTAHRILPDFGKPPVVETVLDVGFLPLAGWGIPHFGLFWQTIKDTYPSFQDQPPVILQKERFGEEAQQPLSLAFELINQPEARCWFINESQTRLIQVQRDRFIHNWRKMEGKERYPHYEEAVRPAFESEWNRFCEFLLREGLGPPDVQQCEVQYVNHIPLNGWKTFTDVIESLSNWPGAEHAGFLPAPESLVAITSYLMPGNAGRLRIVIEPAVRSSDGSVILQLKLIARGKPESSGAADILNWFDLGREWIVRGFTDFTSPGMHKIWERNL